ncbi:hypothetical protein FO519_000884 [Halicephalobus sp. NKZ332]|nr:hypothetical protein FO519_000884 [Halicephalobus sp. NKZ332]
MPLMSMGLRLNSIYTVLRSSLSPSPVLILPVRCSSEISFAKLKQAYINLGLDESASTDDVKSKFAKLAKLYHPDTGGAEANPAKLLQVRASFKLILKSRSDYGKDEEIDKVTETIEQDIRHTAPQHRQYLEYGGLGLGTPSERQKQYQQYKIYNAVEAASNFMMDKAIRESASASNMKAIQLQKEKNYFSKKHKLTGMIERVVEELIMGSMGSGDFSNLKGSGKPLKQDFSNPYIDETEKKINDILKNNGFAPPWIMKEAEIRVDMETIRKTLREEYARFQVLQDPEYLQTTIGKYCQGRWNRIQSDMKSKVVSLNRLIMDYNLVSPSIGRQFIQLLFDRELEAAKKYIDEESGESKNLKEEAKERIERELSTMKAESGFWEFLRTTQWDEIEIEAGLLHEENAGVTDPRNMMTVQNGTRGLPIGAEAAKARLHEKLSTAISDLKDPKYTTTISADRIDHHKFQSLNLSAAEARIRQEEINKIESDGFVQTEFKSSKSSKNHQPSSSSTLTDHEKAMFGAQWQSKALEKNLKTTDKKEKEQEKRETKDDEPSYPLAGEIFYKDSEAEQAGWLQLFKERRRQVLMGE